MEVINNSGRTVFVYGMNESNNEAFDINNYNYELSFGYYTNKTYKAKYDNLGMFPYLNVKDDDEAINIAERLLVKDYANKDKTHKNLFVIVTNIKTNQVIKVKNYTR